MHGPAISKLIYQGVRLEISMIEMNLMNSLGFLEIKLEIDV